MKKREGKSKVILDILDIIILRTLATKNSTGSLTRAVGLTPSNMITHIQRLLDIQFIEKERDKQTIYISITKKGRYFLKSYEQSLEEIQIKPSK